MAPAATKQSRLVAAHCNPPLGMMFFDTLQAFRDAPDLLGYFPVVERAWQNLGLDGVLFSHGRPLLYLKESKRPFRQRDRIRWHRLFWNQGVANVLVLADPSNVYVYSALARPVQDDATEEQALVQTLRHAEYAQRTKSFFSRLDTGAYYEDHKDWFQPDKTVDEYLLVQLRYLRDELTGEPSALPVAVAHAFLGRLLFACYLLDRGIVRLAEEKDAPVAKGASRLAAVLDRLGSFKRKREFLYGWFSELKEQFNGTMFDQDLKAERAAIRAPHMKAVVHFLGGHEMRNRQRTFGFWAYDFEMIPVQTISAIYENFLEGEDPKAKRKGGAFYTPRFLAEMVLDIAVEGGSDIATRRCLDPACGSGIFLVTLFSRMASAWLCRQPGKPSYAARVQAFQNILREQIRGIDQNETACRIACFSLYLAYLDRLNPPDIGLHARKTGKALPRLMVCTSDGTETSANLIPVVRHADALEQAADLNGSFDLVIGNPPWKERPDRLAQRFTDKAPDFLRAGGLGCLLLPTALLLNKTDDFQAAWLRRVTLERIVNLADYRHLLFRNAKRPALIARFRNEQPKLETATIQHDAPKFRRDSLREGCITISPTDRSWIPLRNIVLAAEEKVAPLLWKRHLRGTPREQKLLDLLLDMPTLGKVVGNEGWVKGEGFQPYYSPAAASSVQHPPKRCPWPLSTRFVDAGKRFDMLILLRDCSTLGARMEHIGASTKFLRRLPDERLFTPPMVLVAKGFGKVAFCDFPATFQHAVRSITAPPQSAALLMFLTAYLRSPLARYFLFHIAGNWGTERDEVQLDELLPLPFPLPGTEYASAKADRIVREVAQRVRELRDRLERPSNMDAFLPDDHFSARKRRQLTEDAQRGLNRMIYAYFGLTRQEITLVEDTTEIVIPSSTPTTWWKDVSALDPVQESRAIRYRDGIAVYATTLTETLNAWASEMKSSCGVAATGGFDPATGLAMVTLHLSETESDFQLADVSNEVWQALDAYRRSVAKEKQGTLSGERDIVLFKGKKIHIVRPGILANWTRTAALNDAAKIYGDIVAARKTRQ